MSEPTTVGEVLDKWEGKGRATFGQTGGAIHDFTQDLRRSLYGTDEPCPGCTVARTLSGNVTCAICHDTGRLKTPGLVERIDRAQRGDDDGVPLGYIGAIRHEIGETV